MISIGWDGSLPVTTAFKDENKIPRVSWQARLSGIGLVLGLVRDPDPINKVFVGSVIKEDTLNYF